MHCLSLTLVYRGTYIWDPRCQDLRWAHMWLPLIIANSVSAAFMKASVHLPIRSNQPVSQSWLTVGGASSLCQWSVLLPHDYRCDLSHLSTSMRQLSTFLIQTIIAWFSNGLKCKCSELCCSKSFFFLPSWSLRREQDGHAAGAALSLNPGAWLSRENAHFAVNSHMLTCRPASRHQNSPNIQAEIRNTVSDILTKT